MTNEIFLGNIKGERGERGEKGEQGIPGEPGTFDYASFAEFLGGIYSDMIDDKLDDITNIDVFAQALRRIL